tara:strand:- start:5452 stop:6792 length:1341 start_codon:yes stop_codon:yes gene_type:complete
MNKNFLEDIIKKLKKKGASESDAIYFESESVSASCRLGKIEKTERSEIKEIGIRTIINNRQSIVSTTNLESDNIDYLIEQAFDMAKIVPEDKFCGLASEEQLYNYDLSEFEKLNLFDNTEIEANLLIDNVQKLENSALENKKIINSEGAEIASTKNKFCLLGTNGLSQEFSKSHSDYIVAVLAGDSNSMEREYDYKSKVFYNDLGDFEQIGKNVAEKAIKKLDSRKIKTCRTGVIFDSRVSSSLLSNLFNACNSSRVIRGTSFLKNKIGNNLFKKNINILDNPTMKRRLRSRVADCEGIKCSKRSLVKNGELTFFFNSLSSARELKNLPTGHASRGVSSLPSPSYTNLYLENGDQSIKQLIKSVGDGLLVTELMGTSINYSNGDYSRGASGFWIGNGDIQFPVSEITIAGNLNNMFGSLIPANDLEFNYSVNAPSCLVENMMVGGV